MHQPDMADIPSAPEAPALSHDIVTQMLADHAVWLETEGREGKRFHLRGMMLRGMDFHGANLVEASLKGADLSGADFSEADLRRADLSESALTDANFRGARMGAATLTRSDASGGQFHAADMAACNLSHAVFARAEFIHTKLAQVNLRESDLQQAVIQDAALSGAVLRSANLAGSRWTRSDATGADFRDTYCKDAVFTEGVLEDAQFRGAMLENVDLGDSDFASAQDVAAEYQHQSFLQEKKKLSEEKHAIRRMREEMNREMAGIRAMAEEARRQKLRLHDLRERGTEYLSRYKHYAAWFGFIAFAWLVFTLCFAGISAYQVAQLDLRQLKFIELFIVFGLVGGVLGMFGFTALRARQIGQLLKEYGSFHALQVTALRANLPEIAAENPAEAEEEQDDKVIPLTAVKK